MSEPFQIGSLSTLSEADNVRLKEECLSMLIRAREFVAEIKAEIPNVSKDKLALLREGLAVISSVGRETLIEIDAFEKYVRETEQKA